MLSSRGWFPAYRYCMCQWHWLERAEEHVSYTIAGLGSEIELWPTTATSVQACPLPLPCPLRVPTPSRLHAWRSALRVSCIDARRKLSAPDVLFTTAEYTPCLLIMQVRGRSVTRLRDCSIRKCFHWVLCPTRCNSGTCSVFLKYTAW